MLLWARAGFFHTRGICFRTGAAAYTAPPSEGEQSGSDLAGAIGGAASTGGSAALQEPSAAK